MQDTDRDNPIETPKTNTVTPVEDNKHEVKSTAPISPSLISKLKQPKILALSLVVLFILVASGAGLYLYKSKVTEQKRTKIQTTGNTSPTSAPVNQQPYKEKNWVLKKNIKMGTEAVLNMPDRENQIVSWGDYLIYGSGGYSSNVQVFSYNFKTGETKTVYDQESRNDFESGRNNRYVSDMQVINNTLFFSIGGYLTSGATFWMVLPPTGQPQKLTGGANGRIQYWKDRYWLINGEGDACWGSTSYSLIDLTTKKVTEIATSTSGCFEGEEFVDIDKRNKMILAFHTAGTGEGGDQGNGIYQYVVAVPLNNPTVKEGVIAKQDMPEGITSVVYLPDTDILLLTGKEKYFFNFLSKAITKTDTSPVIPTPLPSESSQNKTFKDKIIELVLPTGYEFVLE